MKFLVTVKPRQIQQGMTSKMVQATQERVNDLLKSGTYDCVHICAGGSDGVVIVNADSGEALAEALDSPAAPFFDFEVRPLTDFNKAVSKTIAVMKKQGL
jgi:hypothetical protein